MAAGSSSAASSQPSIVGRDREQAALRSLLDGAISGDGSLVLVSGEAGIGKTTLVRDLSRVASDLGCLVLSGGCYDLTTTPAHGPWIEAIFRSYRPSGTMPDMPATIRDEEGLRNLHSQDEVFSEVTTFLLNVASDRPLVVVLEDLHWADPTSLDLLRHVARWIDGQPILLIGSYRDNEITRRHELYGLLPLLVRESRTTRISLARLSSSDIAGYIETLYEISSAERPRLVEYLFEHGEGNPFYTGELLRGLEESGVMRYSGNAWELGPLDNLKLPSLVRQIIDVRLDRLEQTTQELLRVAAVIGQFVPYGLWQSVSGEGDTTLATVVEEALDASILEESDGNGFRFTHALVREALYEQLILPRRKLWHSKVGEELAANARPDPNEVAHHFRRASDERAVEWLIRAGDRAQRAYAWQTAIERFEEAIDNLPDTGDRARVRGWLFLRVGVLLRFADTVRGLEYLDEAARSAVETDDQALEAHALFNQGRLRCISLDVRRGLEAMAAGMDKLRSLPVDNHDSVFATSPSWVADVLPPVDLHPREWTDHDSVPSDVLNHMGTYALWLAWTGHFQHALEVAEPFIVHAATLPAITSGYGDACNALGASYAALGKPAEARRMFNRAREAYQSISHHILDGTAASLYMRDVILVYDPEQIAERRRIGSEAEAAWLRGASGGGVDIPARVLLPLMMLEGRWNEARQIFLDVPDDFRARFRDNIGGVLGMLAREQGEADDAWSWIYEAMPDGPHTAPGGTLFTGYGLVLQRLAVMLALDAEDAPLARAWLEGNDHWLEWSGSIPGRAENQLLWARYHLAGGDPEAAYNNASAALRFAREPRQPLAVLASHRCLGHLAILRGRFVEAREHLSTALEIADACAAPYQRALTLLEFARLHALQNDVKLARQTLGEVRQICEPVGARLALRWAAEIEAQLAPSLEDRPAGLTPRELDVLRLVAEGLTDVEVAERLFVSPRTVSSHLASIYTKLDVPTRTAATRFAVERGIL